MAVEPSDLPTETERRFDANHPLPLLEATITGFIGRTQRGPLCRPVLVKSFEEFRRVFGGHGLLGFVSHAVADYFAHGGHSAVVVRVANRATRACIDIPAGAECLRLQARDPGSHEFLRVSIDYDRVESDLRRFNLVVQRLGKPGSELVEDQEFFQAVSIDHATDRFVVDALKDSNLIRLSGPLPRERPQATCAKHPGQPIPYLTMTRPGSDGEELTDYDIIGSNEEGTGLFAFEAVERLDLLCVPSLPGRELGVTSFLAAERYCERRKAMLIWDPPWAWESAHAALIGARSTVEGGPNAMTYFPRVRARDGADRQPRGTPACGVVAGILTRGDRKGARRSPDGDDGLIKSQVSPMVELTPRQAELLKRHGVNVFVRTGSGVAFRGNVTFTGSNPIASFWRRLDRCRLAFYVLGTLERRTRWALEEPDDDQLWPKLIKQVETFFNGLLEQGALCGQRAQQAFFVQPGQRTRSWLVFRVGFSLERPGEFLVYEIRHRAEGSTTRRVTPLEAAQLVG